MKISVVMTNYNHGPFLQKNIDGILNQTYDNFEFIIVDDGSTDMSAVILSQYEKKDPRLKLFLQPTNKGFQESFALAWSKATGDLTFCYAADDYITHLDFFKIVVDELTKNKQACGVYGISQLFYETGEYFTSLGMGNGIADVYNIASFTQPNASYLIPPQEFLEGFLTHKNFIPGFSVMFRKKLIDDIGGYPMELGPQCDYFINHALPSIYGVVFVPQVFSYARTFKNGSNYSTEKSAEKRVDRHAMFEKKMRGIKSKIDPRLWIPWRERLIKDISDGKDEWAAERFKELVGV